MKNIFLTITTLLALNATAGVITCSNNSNSPGQYTDLQDAIDNANANDTILVAGSTTDYGAITINEKAVTLIGAGYNNPNGENSKLSTINLYRVSAIFTSSGSNIIGFNIGQIEFSGNFSGGTTAQKVIENIKIERCSFRSAGTSQSTGGNIVFRYPVSSNDSYNNIIVNNCLFEDSYWALNCDLNNSYTIYEFNNFVFSNNIFDNASIVLPNGPDYSSLIFKNNLFINQSLSTISYGSGTSYIISGPLFESNIFYAVDPDGAVNCTFNNNLTYVCTNDNLIYSGNPGSIGGANVIGQDPMFANYPAIGGAFSYTYDFDLLTGSPAIGTGNAGVDIGIKGGVLPYEIGANPAIPQMQEITTPLGSGVSKGTNLNVTFKSYKQD